MRILNPIVIVTPVFALSVMGCSASHDHAGHDHANGKSDSQSVSTKEANDRFGHLSAIYLCGDDQLQTSHTAKETKLAYKGAKIDVVRSVTVIDDAFGGETFKGRLNGQPLVFKGKGYDAKLTLGNEVIACEKLSCIPLGGPH